MNHDQVFAIWMLRFDILMAILGCIGWYESWKDGIVNGRYCEVIQVHDNWPLPKEG